MCFWYFWYFACASSIEDWRASWGSRCPFQPATPNHDCGHSLLHQGWSCKFPVRHSCVCVILGRWLQTISSRCKSVDLDFIKRRQLLLLQIKDDIWSMITTYNRYQTSTSTDHMAKLKLFVVGFKRQKFLLLQRLKTFYQGRRWGTFSSPSMSTTCSACPRMII